MKQSPLGQGSIGARLETKLEITAKTHLDGCFWWPLKVRACGLREKEDGRHS